MSSYLLLSSKLGQLNGWAIVSFRSMQFYVVSNAVDSGGIISRGAKCASFSLIHWSMTPFLIVVVVSVNDRLVDARFRRRVSLVFDGCFEAFWLLGRFVPLSFVIFLLIASAPHCTIHIGRETSRLRVRCCVEDDETLGGSLVPPSYHDFTQCQLCKSGCVNENELKSRWVV